MKLKRITATNPEYDRPVKNQMNAVALEGAWREWPRSFASFMQRLDREEISYLSYSRVSDYQRCPLCYYRRNVLRIKETTQAMLLGTLFHKAAARAYTTKRSTTPERLFGRLNCSKLEEERRPQLQNALALLCQNRHVDCGILSVEEPFFLDLAPGLPPVIGIADLVLRTGKTLLVVDHKTSKSFQDHDAAQLVLYAEHARRAHNAPVPEGCFDEYRLVPNLDRIRKPAFRRTTVKLNRKMLTPLIRDYEAAWGEIQLLKRGDPPASGHECWFCRPQWY